MVIFTQFYLFVFEENSRGAGNLQDLKRQALQEKRDEIARLEKNLADFQKERDYLLDNKEYFSIGQFHFKMIADHLRVSDNIKTSKMSYMLRAELRLVYDSRMTTLV